MKYHKEEDCKHTNSPILSRLRPPTPKLTNSPIVSRKAAATKMLNSPMLDRPKHLAQSSQQAKNIGYFTCVENRYIVFQLCIYVLIFKCHALTICLLFLQSIHVEKI